MNKDLKYTGDVIDGSSGDMSQERSGIYQDRVNGKLPMDRVKGHYQMRDAKMAQVKKKQIMPDTKATSAEKPAPKPGEKGYNKMIAEKNAAKKAGAESGIVGTIKKYAKKVDKYLTGTSGATGSGF